MHNWILKSLPNFLQIKHFCGFLMIITVTEELANTFIPSL